MLNLYIIFLISLPLCLDQLFKYFISYSDFQNLLFHGEDHEITMSAA